MALTFEEEKEIRNSRVSFKSTDENYKVEESGDKANTVRRFWKNESDQKRKAILDRMIKYKIWGFVRMTNGTNASRRCEQFVRNITNVTVWKNWYIISWDSRDRG